MQTLGQQVRTPLVVEASAIDFPAPVGSHTQTVLQNVAAIHASYIDVFFVSPATIVAVFLVLRGASRLLAAPQQVAGAYAPGVVGYVRWGGSLAFGFAPGAIPGEFMPQTYDVAVRTTVVGVPSTITLWTAARSA